MFRQTSFSRVTSYQSIPNLTSSITGILNVLFLFFGASSPACVSASLVLNLQTDHPQTRSDLTKSLLIRKFLKFRGPSKPILRPGESSRGHISHLGLFPFRARIHAKICNQRRTFYTRNNNLLLQWNGWTESLGR